VLEIENKQTPFRRHLQSHGIWVDKRKAPPSVENVPNLSEEETQEIHVSLASYIITDYLPLSMVDSTGFRKFVKSLGTPYDVPSRKTIEKYVLTL
jgi:hypothetical protein